MFFFLENNATRAVAMLLDNNATPVISEATKLVHLQNVKAVFDAAIRVVIQPPTKLEEQRNQKPIRYDCSILKDYPGEDWLHLTGLIHGDTFPVGCAFDKCNVHHKIDLLRTVPRYLDRRNSIYVAMI
ncbi:inositol oxygenase 2 isoform X2 [Canna indica]|uniref:Inositol oxygenase 2 isoform X2 n=1 Tax=Canna indica TaxID=4628 RepID=A0AAQ3K276_9LILI|nr:inositol oxygenase 2 isoform X2 [Canna indica]